ncbi:MAG: type II secretion system F family protein [Opitutaceae bacterium]|nr:type II secretion system F family protein [Opitutaceae bacterium]
MPLGHKKLSAWYHQLAQQLEAGLPLADALRSSRGTGMPPAGLETMAQEIERGGSIEQAFSLGERWLPLSDRQVVCAAAEAGRMPHILNRLSTRHAELGTAKLRLLLACGYPIAILHLGLVLLPVMRMIDWEKGLTWDALAYARALASLLLPLWAAIALLMVLGRRRNPWLLRVGRTLPFVGGYIRAQALADFSFTLGNFLETGMLVGRAWSVAGSTATLPELKTAAQSMGPVIERGEKPGTSLARWPCFPADFVALYHTGETTGQLDQNLLRLARQYQERANRSLTAATLFYPALMFAFVAGAVALAVVKMYGGYLKSIANLAT